MKHFFWLLTGIILSLFLSGCSLLQPKTPQLPSYVLCYTNNSTQWRLEKLESAYLTLENKVKNLEQKVKCLEKQNNKSQIEEKNLKTELKNEYPKKQTKETSLSTPQQTDLDLYKQGLNLILHHKPQQGRKILERLIKLFPKTKLLPNAYYWIGESYYSEKQYAQSILAFKKVTSLFPKHYKAAHALLKIAYAYAELGDKQNAKFYLNILLQDYPKSDVVSKARAKLKTL
ncbi:MAG: tetratricopeptide repeat protein [Desulfonauticus sp.]|nr:tetratricopeptide repeat protein [Desulfonauticus sp.]